MHRKLSYHTFNELNFLILTELPLPVIHSLLFTHLGCVLAGFFLNQADLHGLTLGSLFSFHLAETEYVRSCNQCYLRAGIPPKFPPWGEYRKSKTYPDSSLLILQPLSSGLFLTRKRCHGANTHFAERCKTRALKLCNGQGLELTSCQDSLEQPRPPCFNPDESMEAFPDAPQVILRTRKFYLIK